MAVVLGECGQAMRGMEENSIDSIVTDPPYGLEFMGKDFDKLGKGAAQRRWHLAWAVEAFRVLKPGGYIVAAGGTRTSHHLTSALEEAGFEIRDTINWVYFNGFPKTVAGLPSGLATALKPAHEPFVVARRPLEGTVFENLARWGTGVMNIDRCRHAVDDPMWLGPRNHHIRTHSRSGEAGANSVAYGGRFAETETRQSDGQALFGHWPANVVYVPKASRREREAGCESLPVWKGHEAVGRKAGSAGLANPRAGAGRTAKEVRNHHPTVKPLHLMRWLCQLVTPPGGTVLDPFAGSGTTCAAAVISGFEYVGIEIDPEYVGIANARIEYWTRRRRETVDWSPVPLEAR